ncbi:PH domain-containing protein [Salinactinospora qingdaonensis]
MRVVGYGLAVLCMATMVTLAIILPETWRLQDRLGLVFLGLLLVGGLYLLTRPKVVVAESSVTVVNVIRTYVLEWAEIIDVRMPVGEPWPTVDLADGSTLAVMGIQSNDGALARSCLAQFRALLHERGEAQEPGDNGPS